MTETAKRPTLHVCVATGQNLANLIPALQLGAHEVVVLETPEMCESAQHLMRALKDHKIKVRRWPFDDATPATIVKGAEALGLEFGERPLVFNATGGHKLLTLALAEQMNVADDLHVLYAETRHDRIDWLKPTAVMQPMEDVLRLQDILLAQGYRLARRGDRDVRWMQELSERESLTRRLGDQADRLSGLFGAMNHLANEALANEDNGPFRPRQTMLYPPRDGSVLRDAEKCALLHWNGGSEIVFASKEAARYFRGGWLEEYALLKLRGLRPSDFASTVELENVRTKTRNEFDALVVHRNRLLVIECKTARFGRDAARDADYVYKLAQLARSVGGLMATGLLLSARSVPSEVRQRAEANDIKVLAGEEIKQLAEILKVWMKPS